MQTSTTQISIDDWLVQRRDNFISDWEGWRSAQFSNDCHKDLVDSVYTEIIGQLDELIDELIDSAAPF